MLVVNSHVSTKSQIWGLKTGLIGGQGIEINWFSPYFRLNLLDLAESSTIELLNPFMDGLRRIRSFGTRGGSAAFKRLCSNRSSFLFSSFFFSFFRFSFLKTNKFIKSHIKDKLNGHGIRLGIWGSGLEPRHLQATLVALNCKYSQPWCAFNDWIPKPKDFEKTTEKYTIFQNKFN